MVKKIGLLILLVSAYSFCFAQSGSNETVTIATYYPSPYGVYNEMRTNKMVVGDTNSTTTPSPSDGAVTFYPVRAPTSFSRGTLYFDNTADTFKYRDSTGWQAFGVASGAIYVGATPLTYTGAGVGGYDGGDAKCNVAYSGSRMCAASDFANGRPPPTVTGWYSTFSFSCSAGSVGGCIIHDCRSWTLDSYYGIYWDNTGGNSYCQGACFSACSTPRNILCCK